MTLPSAINSSRLSIHLQLLFVLQYLSRSFLRCLLRFKLFLLKETMSNEHAMRFPLVGSAMLLSLFLLFKLLLKDLVNAVFACCFFVLGIAALSATLLAAIKRFFPKKWNENLIIWHFPYFRSLDIEFTRSQIVAAISGTIFCVWYAKQKHWLANNVLALAFCIQEMLFKLLVPMVENCMGGYSICVLCVLPMAKLKVENTRTILENIKSDT